MIDPKQVNERLTFAKQRLEELVKINKKYRDLSMAKGTYKQQLIQEFFFHLVGAIEFLTQLVNISKNLGINIEDVTVGEVCNKLPRGDRISVLLKKLRPKTRGEDLPPNPYSDEGCHFRILVHRHRVTHQTRNPFFIRVVVPGPPKSSLFLDPRDPKSKGSKKLVIDELNEFWDLVNDKCQKVLTLL